MPSDSPTGRGRSDPLRRFYTRPAVGAALASLLPLADGCRILDLASGGGALAAALGGAPREVVAVDLDPEAVAASVPGARQVGIVADALSPDLADLVGRDGFDVAVCNPPYRAMAYHAGLPALFERAGLAGALGGRRQATAEATIAAQALGLVREGGAVGLVVPDGLVSGRLALPFRRALLAGHRVLAVAQLPPSSFADTEARAHLLVAVRGGGPSGPVRVTALVGGVMAPGILVAPEDAVQRMDHAHHARRGAGPTLGSLGARVVRGSLEAPRARSLGIAPFHTADFPSGEARSAHDLSGFSIPEGVPYVTAGPGDILVARLHRSLHRKVCGVSGGSAVLSAAVLRLRVPVPARDAVLAVLLSPDGEAALAAASRGTAARMLGQADLLGMPLPRASGLA